MPSNGPKWLPGILFLHDTPTQLLLGPSKLLALLSFFTLGALAKYWHGQVTSLVPEPYLDEVFHVPQALAYCEGRYGVWDPKLTTPPGLYAFAVMFIKTQINGTCNVYKLRLFNVFALLFTMVYACDCRALISSRPGTALKNLKAGIVSAETLHTALNIALFPPLFFFSGLFYTDVLSTALVLRMYTLFLQGGKGDGKVWLYLTGMVALTMRQTNVFWVAVFMGGLEAVRTIEGNKSPAPSKESVPKTWQEHVVSTLKKWSRGEIHDIFLRDAGVHDLILCALSIGIAVISKPVLILASLWPYIALLVSFAGFVFWNGGVVLGDKSNHVATIHLPQLLYIWPFIAFFSFPLILPPALSLLSSTLSPSIPRAWKYTYALNAVYITSALVLTLGIIKYNTIIHPFTLADNRHYIFYVFRYSILRHAAIRYLLAPVYLVCAYLVSLTLSPPSPLSQPQFPSPTQPPKQTTSPKTPPFSVQETGPKTSFALILLLTTTLSLVTAPLVEPRYFIVPWVLWRLHVPGNGKRAYDWRLWAET
ncbi:Dol-P-Glc:Glc(2)Man(9)GlcNAc(2)-PP-Dol alpha-1,2-glucosyltransferase, partial [Lachnellula subtilissima]